jgi:Cu+-exporting ATPase
MATERRCAMERDVVCGMQVDPGRAAGSSVYNGRTYYFCSTACKARFDANPEQFTSK